MPHARGRLTCIDYMLILANLARESTHDSIWGRGKLSYLNTCCACRGQAVVIFPSKTFQRSKPKL